MNIHCVAAVSGQRNTCGSVGIGQVEAYGTEIPGPVELKTDLDVAVTPDHHVGVVTGEEKTGLGMTVS